MEEAESMLIRAKVKLVSSVQGHVQTLVHAHSCTHPRYTHSMPVYTHTCDHTHMIPDCIDTHTLLIFTTPTYHMHIIHTHTASLTAHTHCQLHSFTNTDTPMLPPNSHTHTYTPHGLKHNAPFD